MAEKTENTNNNVLTDWELAEDFYQSDQSKSSLSLEDFMESGDRKAPVHTKGNEEVEKTANDVKRILSFMQKGKNTQEIAAALSLNSSYVQNIQICIQAFPEDSPVAVAHLVLMG